MADKPVELEPLGYQDLTPWEVTVFHEEARLSMGDMQRMAAAARAATAAGSVEMELGDLPIERVPLALIAAAARRHTGNPDLSLQEAGSGRFRFRAEDDDEAGKDEPPEPTPAGESPM